MPPESRYKVGDHVTVVENPVECRFKWIETMDKMCGQRTVITNVSWSTYKNAWSYNIAEDVYRHMWCENCFQETYCLQDLPDFEAASTEMISSLFS